MRTDKVSFYRLNEEAVCDFFLRTARGDFRRLGGGVVITALTTPSKFRAAVGPS